jgi:hypothetical protein
MSNHSNNTKNPDNQYILIPLIGEKNIFKFQTLNTQPCQTIKQIPCKPIQVRGILHYIVSRRPIVFRYKNLSFASQEISPENHILTFPSGCPLAPQSIILSNNLNRNFEVELCYEPLQIEPPTHNYGIQANGRIWEVK